MSGYLGSLFREKGSKMALYYAQKTWILLVLLQNMLVSENFFLPLLPVKESLGVLLPWRPLALWGTNNISKYILILWLPYFMICIHWRICCSPTVGTQVQERPTFYLFTFFRTHILILPKLTSWTLLMWSTISTSIHSKLWIRSTSNIRSALPKERQFMPKPIKV